MLLCSKELKGCVLQDTLYPSLYMVANGENVLSFESNFFFLLRLDAMNIQDRLSSHIRNFFLTYETEFAVSLSVLDKSFLPMG